MIREALIEDLDTLADHYDNLLKEILPNEFSQDEYNSMRDPYIERLRGDDIGGYVAIEGDEVIGSIVWYHVKGILNLKSCGDSIYIHCLWVDDDCRSRGHGKKLMDAAISYAKENSTTLKLKPSSQKAISLYKKMGFKECAPIMKLNLR